MTTPVAKTDKKAKYVDIEVRYLEMPFKWQMAFNRFAVEQSGSGKIVRFWYYQPGIAPEIVPIHVSAEGIAGLRQSSQAYARTFSAVPPYENKEIPMGKMFSPLFSNVIRMATSGATSEIAFFLMPLHEIAAIVKSDKAKSAPAVPVAIFHSEVEIHRQVVMELLSE